MRCGPERVHRNGARIQAGIGSEAVVGLAGPERARVGRDRLPALIRGFRFGCVFGQLLSFSSFSPLSAFSFPRFLDVPSASFVFLPSFFVHSL